MVAARLGALLHDLAHVPFGHSIEDDLGILPAHDKGTERFEHLWQELATDLERRLMPEERRAVETLIGGDLAKELRPMILSKEERLSGGQWKRVEPHKEMRYPFVADLVGNTICADLIDYLARDHLYSGLPMALGHRFLDAFFVTGTDRTRLACRMALSIVRENRERTDIVTELLKYLRYRYELTERVLVHHAKLSADAMVGKALELWFDELHDELSGEARPGAVVDGEDSGEGDTAAPNDADLETSDRDLGQDESGEALVGEAGGAGDADQAQARVGVEQRADPLDDAPEDDSRQRARKRLERRLLMHGDDGLLEYLRDWCEPGRVSRRLRIEDDLSSGQENLQRCQEDGSTQRS